MDRSPATVLIWLVAAVLAVLVGMRLVSCGGGGGGEAVRIDGAAAPGVRGAERSRRATVVVHVAGAVRSPGLYRVVPTARVAAALARAGGPVARADLDALNLAARVQDGQQIVVPRRGGDGTGLAGGAAAGAKPSLGSATVEQLEQLEGIGPTLAERIVAYRSSHGGFRSVDELAEVDGIGEQRLEALREALQP